MQAHSRVSEHKIIVVLMEIKLGTLHRPDPDEFDTSEFTAITDRRKNSWGGMERFETNSVRQQHGRRLTLFPEGSIYIGRFKRNKEHG